MDHDLLAFEVVEQWYASRPGVIANGPSRDRLIAAVRAALDTAAAAARREGYEAAAGACNRRAEGWRKRAKNTRASGDETSADAYQDASDEARECAAAIRALT